MVDLVPETVWSQKSTTVALIIRVNGGIINYKTKFKL